MKEYKRDKRALIPRDEFEEEAGEGLGGLGRDEAEADLLELKSRMERRLRRPRAIWLPAAAALVILLLASALLVTMLRDRRVPGADMELAEAVVTDTAYIAMASPVEKSEAEASVPVESAGKAMTTREVRETRFTPPALVIDDEVAEFAMADEVLIAEEQEADDEVVYMVSPVIQEELQEVVVVEALPQMTRSSMKARAETADRAAVPETDTKKDKAKTEAETATEAKAAGMAVQSVGVPDGPVSPAVGWIGYRKWVSENIRYPEMVAPVIRQEVLVSFTVRADSTLTDIKAVRTPGEPFTWEVFRLLREGPRWVPARTGGKVSPTEVQIMFVFR